MMSYKIEIWGFSHLSPQKKEGPDIVYGISIQFHQRNVKVFLKSIHKQLKIKNKRGGGYLSSKSTTRDDNCQ